MMWGMGWVDLVIVLIVFGFGVLGMAGEVTTTCTASIWLLNTTDSCFMAAMVESPSCKNSALGAVFCKAFESCLDASTAFPADDGKRMVKWCGKIQQCLLYGCGCVICKNFKTSIVVNSVTQIPAINPPNLPAYTNWWFLMYNHTSSWGHSGGIIEVVCAMHLYVSRKFRVDSWLLK